MLEAGQVGANQVEVHQLGLFRVERGDRLAVGTSDAELKVGGLSGGQRGRDRNETERCVIAFSEAAMLRKHTARPIDLAVIQWRVSVLAFSR